MQLDLVCENIFFVLTFVEVIKYMHVFFPDLQTVCTWSVYAAEGTVEI